MKTTMDKFARMCSLLLMLIIPAWLMSFNPSPAHAGVTIVVNRSDDPGGLPCDGTPTNCDLRSAINYANTHGTFNNIRFSDSITQVILSSSMPTITSQGTWIAGLDITGTVLQTRIDGSGMSNGSAFIVDANDVTLQNLSIVNVPPTATLGAITYGYSDIYIHGGKDTRIAGNFLGTLPGATSCSFAGVTRNAYIGIQVGQFVNGTSGLGNGSAYLWYNTIGCHLSTGIFLSGATYTYVGEDPNGLVGPNHIGTDSTATRSIGNGFGIGVGATSRSGGIGAKYNVIRGNQVFHNVSYGIWLYGNSNNNSSSTYLNQVLGNIIASNGDEGVFLENGAFNNKVGGSGVSDRNFIYSNAGFGVRIYSANSNGVLGNYIGNGVLGTASFPNTSGGISIDSASFNTIGAFQSLGPAESGPNVISGNTSNGIIITNSSNNIVVGNLIGTNPAGTAIVANNGNGIMITGNSTSNTIGGNTTAESNLIGGNQISGILLVGSGVTTNTVKYNSIGYNLTNQLSLPNGGDGIALANTTSGNVIGGTGVPNTIAFNSHSGISIAGGAHDNLIDANYVRNNLHYGIEIVGAGTSFNSIYKTFVDHNAWDGIAQYPSASQNQWSMIGEIGNGGLGINLNPTANASGIPHPPFPAITLYNVATHTLAGTATPNATVEIYYVGSFGADPSGYGEGQSRYALTNADGSGNWSVTNPLSPNCVFLSAIQTVSGQSSEFGHNFSNCLYLPLILR